MIFEWCTEIIEMITLITFRKSQHSISGSSSKQDPFRTMTNKNEESLGEIVKTRS